MKFCKSPVFRALALALNLACFPWQNLHAFPEMIRHGYPNCLTCHVSPTGGGLLTPYGRALAQEALSHNSQGQVSSSHSLKPNPLPEWLDLGGDFRFIQLFRDNERVRSARGILMQADVELMATDKERLRVVTTLGRQEPRKTSDGPEDFFISRRHYINVLVGPKDNKEKHQLRLGRFFPAYGLHVPEHPIVTRKLLGFDQDQETYNAEYSYSGHPFNWVATLVGGRPDDRTLAREKGAAIQSSFAFLRNYKVGFNAYTGKGPGKPSASRRTLMGVFGLLGLTPQWYSLVEIDRTYSPLSSWGFAQYFKLGWEFQKGYHFLATQEWAELSQKNPLQKVEAFSLGVQAFPMVHWDLQAMIRKEKILAMSRHFQTAAWLVLHYYL